MPNSTILTKALGLLDLVAASPVPLTLGDIVDQSELPKSSVHRLLVLLREAAVLAYDPEQQTYGPGSRLMRWGVQTLQTDRLASLSAVHMKALCRETGLRVALSVLDQNAVLYVRTCETGAPFRLAPKVGQTSPLHACAAGKLFLAGLTEAKLAETLAEYEFEQCTEFTITDAPTMTQALQSVRQNGFAVSAREEFRQICGLAVPVRGANGAVLAALSIWDVGDLELLESLKSHIATLESTASAIQLSYGQMP